MHVAYRISGTNYNFYNSTSCPFPEI